ncbi:PREDICTED: glycerate dehydrogenase HPR, peroxisomal-like [Tarenaya hassleriana]|uniref:glycerate dehydrogenase HPR, peroxisomal-like n=1 Tax=Tarenaya hassleriana TaxID=28532 RepID=UPI00053C37BB|nr:PREDICTED: glycerate dehydrogenase HPR, peroxisomal-like [Tarenaya hassleriana]
MYEFSSLSMDVDKPCLCFDDDDDDDDDDGMNDRGELCRKIGFTTWLPVRTPRQHYLVRGNIRPKLSGQKLQTRYPQEPLKSLDTLVSRSTQNKTDRWIFHRISFQPQNPGGLPVRVHRVTPYDSHQKNRNLKKGPMLRKRFALSRLLSTLRRMAKPMAIEVYNPNGKYRIISTKPMPGTRWINLLTDHDCRLEICHQKKTILSVEDIISLIGNRCDGVIGQLTEDWGETLFAALRKAGGKAFSNMAVGYNNVDVDAATKYGIAVGNTPGVLTETTAELAASLSLAASRRIVEADGFMRAGLYDGWLPHLFVGNLLKGQTVGVIGAGRIGSAYARMMVEGFKMNLIYYDLYQATRLEKFVTAYGEFLKANGEQPVTWKRASSMEEVLSAADVISLHPVLDKTTFHLVNKESLSLMKKEAILVNCSRGPVIDEAALVEHLKQNPMFRVGLDVFEEEPYMKPGLAEMKNAIVVPHIASASKWTREGMATLAALNVLGGVKGYPIWGDPNRVDPFLNEDATPPSACPSIVNSKALGLPVSKL